MKAGEITFEFTAHRLECKSLCSGVFNSLSRLNSLRILAVSLDGGQESRRMQHRYAACGKVIGIATDQAGGIGVERRMVLDGVLEILKVCIDGLAEDLGGEWNCGENVTHQEKRLFGLFPIRGSSNDVIDIVEADCGNQGFQLTPLGQRPDSRGIRIKRLSFCQDIQQNIGVNENSHGRAPYFRARASASRSL